MRIVTSLIIAFIISGCAHVTEFSKTIWGSSTRALEEARVNGITKTYDCAVGRCYDEVLKIVEDQEYTVFINNKPKATMVVMGIPRSVDTTEVGIFFTDVAEHQTKIYVTSLSSNAKRIVAQAVFEKLDVIFGASDSRSATTIDHTDPP